jgi:hypothetical protein
MSVLRVRGRILVVVATCLACLVEELSVAVGGGVPAEGLAGAAAEFGGDGGEVPGGADGGAGVLGEVLAQQAVGVLAGAALPGVCGSQKQTGMPVATVKEAWAAISEPWSQVSDLARCEGRVAAAAARASRTVSAAWSPGRWTSMV